jgi:hypothetical protein
MAMCSSSPRWVIETLTVPPAGDGLDAVIDGVFEQRLQHQRRNRQRHRNRPDLPVDRKALAQPQLFQFEVLLAEGDLVGEADQFAGIAHRGAKEIGQDSSAASACCGRARISDSTAFSELNRKCGRMRAFSAASRASAWAGEKARERSSK